MIRRKQKKETKSKKAEFQLVAPEAQSVFVSGDFNEWDTASHPLQKGRDGVWKISFDLNPGRYQYRFVVDGEWLNDPNCESRVENPFGTANCLKVVG